MDGRTRMPRGSGATVVVLCDACPMTPGPVAPAHAARLEERFGAPAAREWLAELPSRTAVLCARWSLTPCGGFAGGSTSAVLPCHDSEGRAAVLKLTPDPRLAVAEGDALALWGAPAVPAVWARDDAEGALLLEAIGDGRTLADGEVDAAAKVERVGGDGHAIVDGAAAEVQRTGGGGHAVVDGAAAEVQRVGDNGRTLAADAAAPAELERVGGLLRALRHAPAPGFPSLRERVDFVFHLWLRRREASAAARALVPAGLLERGHQLAATLTSDGAVAPRLVHGDLHPGNVLDGGPARGLVAIDPRPCLGDPAFDAVDFALPRAGRAGDAEARIEALAVAADLDRERLRAWCVAFAALAAVAAARRGPDAAIAPLLALAREAPP